MWSKERFSSMTTTIELIAARPERLAGMEAPYLNRVRRLLCLKARMSAPAITSDESGKHDLERVEIKLLTEGIFRHYGFDFRDYSMPSLKRRVWKRVYAEGLSTISGLQEKIL